MSTASRPRRRRPLVRALAGCCLVAVVSYLSILLLMLWQEDRLVYEPLAPAAFWQEPHGPGVRDVDLTTGEGTHVHAWWCPVEGASAAVLYCHGTGGNLSCYAWQVETIRKELGASVLIFDYPGYGKSGGAVSEADCYAAAEAAYEWLRQNQHLPPEKVFIYGCSLGGGVAVDLASRRPHRALLLASTFTSLPDVGQALYPWLPVHWLARNRFDSLARIGRCGGHVVITHGTADRLIPFAQAEALFAAAAEPKWLLPMEGVGHSEASPAFFRRCRELLGEPSAPVPPASAAP